MHGRLRQAWEFSLLVALLLAAVLLSGCATAGVNRGDVNLVSLQEEWQLGSQLEQEVGKQMRLVNDAEALSYISEIGRRIVSQTELANLPWEFHIVADPSLNAFNTPGGHVYVNTGLIAAADNVAELAGVMAHEISHGVARHGTERLTKAQGLNIGAGLLLGRNPGMVQQIVAQLAGGGAMARFSRNDEREADRLGVRYMHQAGYNPEGLASFFEEMLGQRKRRPSSVEQFFASHPLTEERIQEVRQEAQALPKRGLTTTDSRLARVQQRIARTR